MSSFAAFGQIYQIRQSSTNTNANILRIYWSSTNTNTNTQKKNQKSLSKCKYNYRYILTQPCHQSLICIFFITGYARPKKNVLFLRNCFRSGIRTVGDLVFRNGILDEHHVYQTLIYKQNMYTE